MSEKILFIINPHSGVDRVKALQENIEVHLDQTIFEPEIIYTQYAQHGIILAREAAEAGIKYIVAVGGDGSVNDVMQGIIGTDAVMGIVPKGSGNGLARSLNIPLDTIQAIQLINKCKVGTIDVGNAGGHYFVSNAGVGFDTLVAKKFRDSKRRGLLAYAWIVTKYFWKYKEWDWEIEIDGKLLHRKAFIVTAANALQYGYNFHIAPLADLQDGLLDIVIIKKHPKALGMFITIRAFNKTVHKSKYVEYYKAKTVIIRNPNLKYVQIDGDVHLYDKSELIISVYKLKLAIIF